MIHRSTLEKQRLPGPAFESSLAATARFLAIEARGAAALLISRSPGKLPYCLRAVYGLALSTCKMRARQLLAVPSEGQKRQ